MSSLAGAAMAAQDQRGKQRLQCGGGQLLDGISRPLQILTDGIGQES